MTTTPLSINSKIAVLGAQRAVSKSTLNLSSSYQRLSSGLRINNVGDDAAGLAVAMSLATNSRVYSQGVRNVNDGISLLNVASCAISELQNVLTRISELAEQSASGSLSYSQRSSIDSEAQSLAKEYARIVQSTEFNGIGLFNGELQGLRVQAGYGVQGGVYSGLGGALGTGTFSNGTTSSPYGVDYSNIKTGDFNNDGYTDIVSFFPGYSRTTVQLGNGDGTFRTALSLAFDSYDIEVGDFNGDGAVDLAAASSSGLSISFGNGDGSFGAFSQKIIIADGTMHVNKADLNNDGTMDLVLSGGVDETRYTSTWIGNGNGTFNASSSYGIDGIGEIANVELGDFNNDGIVDLGTYVHDLSNFDAYAYIRIGNGDGSFRALMTTQLTSASTGCWGMIAQDFNKDGNLDIAVKDGDSRISLALSNGDGTFQSPRNIEIGTILGQGLLAGDLNGDGNMDLIAAGDAAGKDFFIVLGNGDGSFSHYMSYASPITPAKSISLADTNNDGVLDILGCNGAIAVLTAITRDGITPILDFSLLSRADALQAIPLLSNAQTRLNIQEGVIGAFQSRLSSTLSILGLNRDNYSAAESRIRDVDVAEESSNLIAESIRLQAATAILAQANQQPGVFLSLLEDGF